RRHGFESRMRLLDAPGYAETRIPPLVRCVTRAGNGRGVHTPTPVHTSLRAASEPPEREAARRALAVAELRQGADGEADLFEREPPLGEQALKPPEPRSTTRACSADKLEPTETSGPRQP